VLINSGSSSLGRGTFWLARLARLLLWLVLAAWVLFALSWGMLHWVIVPRIGEWRPSLERIATRAFGVQVTIGGIRAESTGAIPAFDVRDVRLFDHAGREALHLPQVRAALSVQSLWSGGLEQLVVEQPVLEVRRRQDGHIEVAGIDVSAAQQDSSTLVDWLFSQAELAIRQGELRWQDDTRPDAGPLVLRELDLVMRNPGRQHQWRLDATPPAEWGQRFTLRALMSQPIWQTDASQWRDWSGTLYGDFSSVDLSHLRQHADVRDVLGIEVLQGAGALRCWADVNHGQVTGVTSDVNLAKVAVQLESERAPLALTDLRARFEVHQSATEFEFATQGLAFHTAEGLVWPGGNLRYRQARAPDGALQRVNLQADRVDLLTVHRLASHLPLQDQVHQWFEDLQPRGLVQTLSLQWQAPSQPSAEVLAGRWQAKGQLQGLSLQAGPVPPVRQDAKGVPVYDYGRPGLRGADLAFDLTQDGGEADLTLRAGALEFPGVFEEPSLPFDRLHSKLSWTRRGQDVKVEIEQLGFANADTEGEASGHWRTSDVGRDGKGERFPGVLDLSGKLTRADGARVYRYLPQDMSASARAYLRESVRQGQAQDARFSVKGRLLDFPFERPGSGTFQVKAKLLDVNYAFAPAYLTPSEPQPWPALEHVQADLLIDRAALHITQAGASVVGQPQLRVSQTEAHIGNFMSAQPWLKVQAQVRGPASDALAFINRSPLSHMTGEALKDARMSGATDVRFQLELPLETDEATRAKGPVRFAGNDLRVMPDTPWLENANGVLSFTEQGFSLPSATARLLGGELRFSGGMQVRNGVSVVRFQGQGSVTADGMRTSRDWSWMPQLGLQASGGTPYQAKLEVAGGGLSLQVDSTLQGLGLNLPAPLNKPATQAWPLRFAVQPVVPAKGGAPVSLDRLTLDVGTAAAPVIGAQFERRHDATGTKVLRGALALRMERPPLPSEGVQAQLALGDLDIDAWERIWAQPAGGTGSTGSSEDDGTRAYWPTTFKLEADSLSQGGRVLHKLQAGGSRELDTWRLNATARELDGYLEYRPGTGSSPGRVFARLARLSVPPSDPGDEVPLQEQPANVPALDIVVKEFELGGRSLGRLEVDAVNRVSFQGGADMTREWRLNKFNLTVPEAKLEATGNWTQMAGQRASASARRTALNLKLSIDDSGALLQRFGMAGVVKGGKGDVTGSLGWLGSPLAVHVPSLGGQLKVNVERGQFLKADPGLAKLFGVLSLQALPRRLTLDFRDVFSEGFAFDFVRGDARIEQGVAFTNNLQMKGINAAVLMEGSADLVRETQDLQVVVIPDLNTGTAALVATAINPAVGLGSFLAQYLIGKPLLQAATTQRFHITGSWVDPRVEKMAAARNIENQSNSSASEGKKP